MTAYTLFAAFQIALSVFCLYLVMRAGVGQTWTALATGLAALVWFGSCLKIALEVFKSDFAFHMFDLVAPFSAGAMGALVIVTFVLFVYRIFAGHRL